MNILHLSDLHFGSVDDARNWYSQLADDLKNELDCPRLDLLVASGDVANKSVVREYLAAEQLIRSICDEFGLGPDDVVIVPGNHDINWALAKKSYSLRRRENYKGPVSEDGKPDQAFAIDKGESSVEVQSPAKYTQRFNNFSVFYQRVTGKVYPSEYSEQAILHSYPDHKLLVLALNSAWQIDHHYKGRAGIHPGALSDALNRIRRQSEVYGDWLKVAVWHHPINSASEDRITDASFLERLAQAGFFLGMHGHIHKAETSLYRYDLSPGGRRIELICAGTFGAPTREWTSGYPLQYNLLRLSDTKLIIETRARKEPNGAWKPDAIWTRGPGRDPLPRYEIRLRSPRTRVSTPTLRFASKRLPRSQPVPVLTESSARNSAANANPIKKLLIIASRPKDAPRIRIEREVREICAILRNARSVQFVVEVLWAARIEDVGRALLEFEPQLVHFSGHGTNEGMVFENEKGESHVVSAKALADVFDLFAKSVEGVVESVFFNACFSENQANAVMPYAQYIIGTVSSIADNDAIALSSCFYEALANGRPYEFAYEYALRLTKAKGTVSNLSTLIRRREKHIDSSPQVQNAENRHRGYLSAKTILFVAAMPQDFHSLRIDEEFREVLDALKPAIKRGEYAIQQRWSTRFQDLHQALLDLKPAIVHFSGHGSKQGLLFEDNQGNGHTVGGEAIARLFGLLSEPVECVILNANHSGLIAKKASNVVRLAIGIPSAVTDQGAIAFAQGFYRALNAKLSFEGAFASGCLQREQLPEKENAYALYSSGKIKR